MPFSTDASLCFPASSTTFVSLLLDEDEEISAGIGPEEREFPSEEEGNWATWDRPIRPSSGPGWV